MTSSLHCLVAEMTAQRVDRMIKIHATSKIHNFTHFLHDVRNIINKHENIILNIKK